MESTVKAALLIGVSALSRLAQYVDPAEKAEIAKELAAIRSLVDGDVQPVIDNPPHGLGTVLKELIKGHGNRKGTPESRAAAKAAETDQAPS